MCIKQAKTKKLEPITLALAETYIAVSIFTRESSYCFQRVLAIAICPSVCHTGGSVKSSAS